MPIYFWFTPIFAVFALAEAYFYPRLRGKPYPWKDSLASIAVYLGNATTVGLHVALTGPFQTYVASWRIATIPTDRWWSWIVLFLLVELVYYWSHRLAHSIRWAWASHSVHHSSEQITFPAAGRENWTHTISGTWIVYLPLFLLGGDPTGAFVLAEVNLLYQFFLHTELCPRLGPLEWVLNTPSHHRVHHAVNGSYRNHNFGGVLIVYDRLFGSFVAERDDEPCHYGLTEPLSSFNPFVIAFHGWLRLWRDARSARSGSELLSILVFFPATDSKGRSD